MWSTWSHCKNITQYHKIGQTLHTLASHCIGLCKLHHQHIIPGYIEKHYRDGTTQLTNAIDELPNLDKRKQNDYSKSSSTAYVPQPHHTGFSLRSLAAAQAEELRQQWKPVFNSSIATTHPDAVCKWYDPPYTLWCLLPLQNNYKATFACQMTAQTHPSMVPSMSTPASCNQC